MNENIKIQDFLSLGYLVLLALGIMKDVTYYGIIGINIMEYSSVLDVLLSPLVFLFEEALSPFLVALMIGSLYYFLKYEPQIHEKLKDKTWYRKITNVEKREKREVKENDFIYGLLFLSCLMIFGFFLGASLSDGYSAKNRLNTGQQKINRILKFQDGKEMRVESFGQNSSYIFYVAEGDKNIAIAPIGSNIKEIKILEVKDQGK